MALVQANPELQVIIRQSNNEDVKTRGASLQAIKEWLAKEPHLSNTCDELFIINFLRACNFSIERTKRKLDLYFTMRTAVPELFSNRSIKRLELKEAMKQVTIPPLPTLTPEGKRVVVLRTNEKSPIHIFSEAVVKAVVMIGDVRLLEEKVGVTGDVFIVDAGTFTPAHVLKINLGLVKKFMFCVQEACPVKLKEIHIVNIHPLINIVYNWFKPLLKEKIRSRVYFHTDRLESLHELVPKDVLPEEYGGNAGKLQDLHDAWMKKLEEYTPWFEEQERLKVDESKRPGKPTNYDDFFGMDGSFKELSID